MAIVESENQGSNEKYLDELFSTIDLNRIKQPFNDYIKILNSFFTKYEPDQNQWLIKHFKKFDISLLSKKELEFVTQSLHIANYDENSLQDEHVVLFNEPVLVSELYCSGAVNESSVIRLISYSGFEKKVVTKKKLVTNLMVNRHETTYQIYDMAHGLILPRNAQFLYVKLATIKDLLTDPKKLESAREGINKAQELPAIEMQSLSKKFEDINSMMRIRAEKMSAVQSDIHLLEQEKIHKEKTLENTQKLLAKVQKDHDKVSVSYQEISNELSEKEDQIEDIEAQSHAIKSLLEKEETKLKSLKSEVEQENGSLRSLKTELSDAQREKNLTTLDTIGHSRETGRQLTAYYWFAAFAFAGLVCMAIYIYQNGNNFAETLPYLVHVSAWDILLSRLPLVTATTLIIGGLSGVFFYLIKHIVSLNTEKMTMLKAGILAEQITNSLECKDMTEEQILAFKRDTKIKLIMQVFSKQEPDKNINNLIVEALKAVNSK
jgi:hypothetical protein